VASERPTGVCDGHRQRVALLTDSFEDEYQSWLLETVVLETRALDLDLVAIGGGVLGSPSRASAIRNYVFDLVHPRVFDGVLLVSQAVGHYVGRATLERWAHELHPMPAVSLGLKLDGLGAVAIDHEGGMCEAVTHLVEKHGHRRLAYVGGPLTSPEAEARFAGYVRALEEHAIEVDPNWVVHCEPLVENGAAAIEVLWGKRGVFPLELQAIVAENDTMALSVMEDLMRRGFDVPRELAIVGFDDLEFAHCARVPLTTVRQPVREMVRSALDLLRDALAGRDVASCQMVLATDLVVRHSCGCSPRSRSVHPAETCAGAGQDFEAAWNARWGQVLEEIGRAARGRLGDLETGWADRLFGSFIDQLRSARTDVFLTTIEWLLRGAFRGKGDVSACRDVLLVLRRHALACTNKSSALRTRLEDLFQEALLLTADAGARELAERREKILHSLRVLGETNAAVLAAPDLDSLCDVVARHLPLLGVDTGQVALFTEPARITSQLETLLVFERQVRKDQRERFAAQNLAPAGLLDGKAMVLQPLALGRERFGVALFEYGPGEGAVYERLRESLSAAVKAGLLARAIESARRELEQLAVTDPLTGLYNRRHFTERLREELGRARRYGRGFSLLILDIDGFKEINDLHGHEVGDEVLRYLAGLLRQSVRLVDTVARIGGDEFVILLPETEQKGAEVVAERILTSLNTGPPVSGLSSVGGSIGIATCRAGKDADEGAILRAADGALLRAKREGKNRSRHADSPESAE
jgi:sigma-B regulation protein RsbU (phosphoserine phosphatase)